MGLKNLQSVFSNVKNNLSSKKTLEVLKNTDGELFKAELEWQPSFRLRRKYD